MTRDFIWPAIVALSTVAITAVVVLDVGPPVAPIVAFWFVFFCPGLPYVRLLGLDEPLNEMLLAVALSLSIQAVVSLLLLWVATWTPARMLIVMVVITLFGVLLDGGSAVWRWRPSRGGDRHAGTVPSP